MSNTVQGVLVMLLATSMVNLGAVFQKKAVDQLPAFEGKPLVENVLGVLRAKLWLLGWIVATVGIVLNNVAVGLADMSVVQPLNGFGLVVLVVFSRFYLGEKLTAVNSLGIVAVIAGSALIGATMPPSRAFSSPDEVFGCYLEASSVIALAAFLIVMALLWIVAKRVHAVAGLLFAFVAACCSVLGLTFSKGLFGLFPLVGAEAFTLWPTYLLLPTFLTFSILAMMVQQVSFQKGRAVVVTPVFGAASVALPMYTGYFVFSENIEALTILAIGAIVIGVVLLSFKRAEDNETSKEGELR